MTDDNTNNNIDIHTPYVPRFCFLTKGVGVHREKLSSFEMALRNAGIAPYNLVRVSSIFPPNCKLIPKQAGSNYLVPGQILYCVMSDNATNEPHRLISASVGIAIPKNPSFYGYLSEHHSFGQKEKFSGDYAEDLAAGMLATILGVQFDPDASYDERKEQWKIAGKTFETRNITQSAVGHKNGLWTTVVSGAIFI